MSLFEKRPKPLFQELYENIQENGQLDPNTPGRVTTNNKQNKH